MLFFNHLTETLKNQTTSVEFFLILSLKRKRHKKETLYSSFATILLIIEY